MTTKKNIRPAVMGLAAVLIAVLAASCVQNGKKIERAPARTCLDCHPEMGKKFRQGYVHAPVKQGRCDQCHLPHGLIGGLFLREKEPGLCLSCHRQLKPPAESGSVHRPVADGTCTACHDPHNSPYPARLKAEADQSCFACHDRKRFRKKYVHAVLEKEKGCRTCHDPHFSGNVSLLTDSPDALCRSCHRVDRSSFIKAHSGYPVRNGCLQCHTPHAGDRPFLLRNTVHAPVRQGKCDSCHRVEQGRIRTTAVADTLCLSCHDAPGPDRVSSHQPWVKKQCTACHAVHASDFRLLLAKAPDRICLDCHRQEEDTAPAEKTLPAASSPAGSAGTRDQAGGKTRSVHRPVAEGDCLACHRGHAADQNALLRQDKRALCLSCHVAATYGRGARSHPPAEGQTCDTCHLPHRSDTVALLGAPQEKLCFGCHRRQADERGRLSLHRPFAEGDCVGCHKLHDPVARPFLRQPEQGGVLCRTCHGDIGNADGKSKMHQPVARGECRRCHAAHSADYAALVREQPGRLCLSCHREVDRQVSAATAAHKPVSDGDCLACHAAHGSPHDALLKKGQPMLCLACHRDVARFWRKGVTHRPAVRDCGQCHAAHGSGVEGLLRTGVGTLCGRCHKVTGRDFLQRHHGIRPGPDSCVSCHDAHGGPDRGLLYPVGHAPFLKGTCAPCHKGRAEK